MGLDLTLLVLTHDTPEFGFSHTMLELERSGIAQVIMDSGIETTPVPLRFYTFRAREDGGESHYGNTQETPYGDKLDCMTCGQLAALYENSAVVESDVNRATWLYLGELPGSTRVALYWH